MTQENRQLLLKDLSARLPYYPKCEMIDELRVVNNEKDPSYISVLFPKHIELLSYHNNFAIKPYLRPISSMTEEETKELLFVRLEAKYGKSCAYITNFIKLNEVSFRKEPPYVGSVAIWFSFENKIVHDSEIREYSKCEYLGQINDITLAEIDWLNAHHFDHRHLIEKGLALEAPEGMYK